MGAGDCCKAQGQKWEPAPSLSHCSAWVGQGGLEAGRYLSSPPGRLHLLPYKVLSLCSDSS